MRKLLIFNILTLLFSMLSMNLSGEIKDPKFKVIGFYTGKNDKAHISFVHEANTWFTRQAERYNFIYDSTDNWDNMNDQFLSDYQVVVFLDTRPDSVYQREAFRHYMENGGAWLGFHFCAFALTPSAYPQNWDWYQNSFLGCGEYTGNTWAPTSAFLRVEDRQHPVARRLPEVFESAPNEWYKWQNDLRNNPDIKILLSIDSTSFPLGTGPKQHEIWHEGYYPVVWTNRNYKMLYINMGHNIIDYDGETDKELSFTFDNKRQGRLVLDGLIWLGTKRKKQLP